MAPNKPLRRIDQRPATTTGAVVVDQYETDSSPPPSGAIGAPANLAATTRIRASAVTPTAEAILTWDPAPGYDFGGSYLVRYSEDNTFPEAGTTTLSATTETRSLAPLKTATVYYAQVAAVYRGFTSAWSDTLTITTPADSTPPSAPADLVVAFTSTGDLSIAFTPSTSANYLDTEVQIFADSTMALELARFNNRAGRAVWTAAQNRTASAGSPDASVYVRLRSRSTSGYTSDWVAATATKARPATPGGAVASWDGATGAARWSWSAVADATAYRLTIDGKDYLVADLSFEYSAARNRLDHAGTADPALSWSLVAIDALDQTSTTPASGTATLARPATPSGVAITWDGATGTARWSWTPISGVAYAQLTIDTIARSVYDSRYEYSAAQNRLEHSGSADPDLAWSLVWVDGLGQASETPAAGTATLARPAAPGSIVETWASDPGTAGPDWIISWAAVAGVAGYRLTIDGVARDLADLRYLYTFAQNRQEHSGTADPALSWSLASVDGLGQTSATPATGTATNARPGAPTISAAGGFSTLGITITSTAPADLDSYQIRVLRDGVQVDSFVLRDVVGVWQATTAGASSYQLAVRAVDVFGQTSLAETLSSTISLDVLTIGQLRDGTFYDDSQGTAAATLAGLKDDNRAIGVVTYASGSTWKWTRAQRSSVDRYQNIIIAATGGVGYIGTSADGSNWTWFSGPLGSDGRTLTQVASEAAAQTAAIGLPTNGILALPGLREARFVILGHRSLLSTYTLAEYYPTTTVIADAIRAGSITALQVALNTLTGDNIFGTNLAAIKANLGSVTIDGICSIGVSGGIYQGLGSFASPNTGLKIYSSSSVGVWESWGNGSRQSYIDATTGELVAGNGNVRQGVRGLRLRPYSGATPDTTSYVAWERSGTATPDETAILSAAYNAATATPLSGDSTFYVRAYAGAVGGTAVPYQTELRLQATSDNNAASIGQGEATIRLVALRPAAGSGVNEPYVQIGVRATNVDPLNGELMLRVFKRGVLINNPNSAATPRTPLDVAGAGTFDGNLSVGGNLALTGFLNGVGVGAHPSYTAPSGRIAFWKQGSDFSVLTDGTDTIINAPLSSGVVRFRTGNLGGLTGGDRARIDGSGNFMAAGYGAFTGALITGAQSAPTLGGSPLAVQFYAAGGAAKATTGISNIAAILSPDAADPMSFLIGSVTNTNPANRLMFLDAKDGTAQAGLHILRFGGRLFLGDATTTLGFFGTSGATQYTSATRTAGASYTSNEQAMINLIWNLLVGYALLRIV